MTPDEVFNHYGNKANFSRRTGMTRGILRYWIKNGYIPIEAQRIIEASTEGVLKASFVHANTVSKATISDEAYELYNVIRTLIEHGISLENLPVTLKCFIHASSLNCIRFERDNPDFARREDVQ